MSAAARWEDAKILPSYHGNVAEEVDLVVAPDVVHGSGRELGRLQDSMVDDDAVESSE